MSEPAHHPDLTDFIQEAALRQLIETARDEDLGPHRDDITSRLLVPETLTCTARMTSREPGMLCGLALVPFIIQAYDNAVTCDAQLTDGDASAAGSVACTFNGSLRSILAIERVALNFCCHLSGIASLTRRYADAIAHTKARVYDTRKTIPGLRGLAKYAVACGRGANHRMGLHDAVLVKDNHIAHTPTDRLEATIRDLVALAKAEPSPPEFVEVEVDTLDQYQRVLNTGLDLILLDNMPVPQLEEAVRLRDAQQPGVELEASGGITLDTIRAVAETGVDRIAVGAITHSAPQLDLGLDITPA